MSLLVESIIRYKKKKIESNENKMVKKGLPEQEIFERRSAGLGS